MSAAVLMLASCGQEEPATQDPGQTEAASDTQEASAEPTTEEAGVPALGSGSELYFNMYRELYEGKADDALTGREKNMEDGFFHVPLAIGGEVKEVLVKSRIVTNKIDTGFVFSLVFSEENKVAEVYSIEEMGGSIAARRYFVSSLEGSTLTVCTNNTNSGEMIPLELAPDAVIYDVSDEEKDFGAETELESMDEVVAAADGSGKVIAVWVLSRASQNTGRGVCICGASATGGEHLPGCDGTVLYYWKPWTNSTSIPTTSGYWYLDVEGGEIYLDTGYKVLTSEDIFLDLNGQTIYGPTSSSGCTSFYFLQDASVTINITILDSKGGGKIKPRSLYGPDGNLDGSLQSRFAVYTGPKHCMTIYGGTIDGSEVEGAGGQGTLIRVINGGILNIHGGTLIGTKGTSNTGNCVFCSGTMNMSGGTIMNGKSKKGGNVFIGSYENAGVTYYGKFYMTGGVIKNGSATICGGNLAYYADGVFEQTGGEITGGKAPDDPEIYIYPKFDPAA